MRRHWNLLGGAAGALRRHALRGAVTVVCLVAAIAPYQAALCVQGGVLEESAISIAAGPDLYVAGSEFGQNASLPLALLEKVRALPKVTRVRPRIAGRMYAGDRLVTLVGVDDARAALAMAPRAGVEGDVQLGRGQALVGAGVARALGVKRGEGFALEGDRVVSLEVTEVFGPESGLHASNLVVVTLEDAGEIFGVGDRASDFLVWVERGAEEEVAGALRGVVPRARVQTRELVRRYTERGVTLRGGVFAALNLAALALAVPALLITSGMGLAERRREIGVLKATGWSTDDVLEMAFWECLLMAVAAAAISAALVWTWLRPLNGWGIAQFFIAGTGGAPSFLVPARFAVEPVAVGFSLALAILVAGAAPTSWRAASVPPADVLR